MDSSGVVRVMVRCGRAFAGLQRPGTAGQLPPCKPLLLQCAAGIPMSPQRARFALHNQFLRVFIILSLHWSTKEELQFPTSTPLKAALTKSVFLIDARVSPAQIPSQMITGDGRSAHQLLYSINFRILSTPCPPNTQAPKHPRQNARQSFSHRPPPKAESNDYPRRRSKETSSKV